LATRNIMNTFMDGKKKQEMDYTQDENEVSKGIVSKDKLDDRKDRDSKVYWTRV